MINLFMSHYKKKSYFNAARFCLQILSKSGLRVFFSTHQCAIWQGRRCLALWIGWVTCKFTQPHGTLGILVQPLVAFMHHTTNLQSDAQQRGASCATLHKIQF